MQVYLALKLLHIISSVVLAGVGFGSAYYLFFTNRSRDVAAIAPVLKLVVRADFWFTTPAILIQPLTGYAMAHMAGYSIAQQSWLLFSIALYVLAGLCWLPVVWIQLRMSRLAQQAHGSQAELSADYWRLAKYWEWLGYPAFVAILLIYWLMVFKPAL